MGWFKDLGSERPWAQGCVIFSAGVALAISGCFGFLLSLDYSGGVSRSAKEFVGLCCGGLFVLGALALPVGFVWWIVGLVRANARKAELASAAAVAPPPPPPDAPAGA